MKLITWFKSNHKMTFIIGMIALAILLSLFIRSCATKQQHNQDVVSAVAQSKIDELNGKIKDKEAAILLYEKSEDSLWVIVKKQNIELDRVKQKNKETEAKYTKERNKVKELYAEDAVDLFLTNTEQLEFPVIQFEDSTKYVIPIHSIEYANVMAVDLKEQIEITANVKKESSIKSMQIKNLNLIIDDKENQLIVLREVNKYTNYIIAEKDTQIVAEKKKLKQQKVKTYFTGVIGGLLVIFSLAL